MTNITTISINGSTEIQKKTLVQLTYLYFDGCQTSTLCKILRRRETFTSERATNARLDEYDQRFTGTIGLKMTIAHR